MAEETSVKRILTTGNEALALGALKAGLKFYAAYPMTPASSILHFMASKEHEYKIIVKHTEDEIAAMNMVIGASLAGVRAMCGTAGGGFSLMVEALGFGAIIETPFVCVVGTRPGPATGMPTWHGQGDLRFVMHAAQDEFPRIVLAPGSPVEAFRCAYRAFNLADRYQLPVILLTDKFLAESWFTSELSEYSVSEGIDRGKVITEGDRENPNRIFKRYDPSVSDGVSPRSLPGTPGYLFLANSDEHDEYGYSEEESEGRVLQMSKRMRKLDMIVENQDAMPPAWYGPPNAKTTLIAWGSTKISCVEAIRYLEGVNVLHFHHLYPLPIEDVRHELEKIKSGVCVECNYGGLFADYLFEKTGYQCEKKILKYDGRPFFVEELVTKIKES